VRNKQNGQALVETALAMVFIVIPLLLGAVDLSMAMMAKSNINYVAEESARCLAVDNPNCGDLEDYASGIAPGVGLSGRIEATSNGCNKCKSVTITYSYTPIFPFIFPTLSLSTTAQYTIPTQNNGNDNNAR
jgi:hypothetical protein